MKRLFFFLVFPLALAACSSLPSGREGARLALYKAHAGAPVSSFHYFGRLDSWESLGDDTLAIWTRPRQAWLLELAGPCTDLQYSPIIALTSQFGDVLAGVDKVLVRNHSSINVPCWIHKIRPLDVNAIREAERAARAQTSQASSGTY